jgi:glycerol-3-phosphate O-acyltransferase
MRALLLRLLYGVAWLLFRPLNGLVKYATTPPDLRAHLKLDPDKPVVFILATRDWSDLFVLERICHDLGLPTPSRTGQNFPTPTKAGVVYMPALLETRVRRTELGQLIETGVATKDFDAQLVPVSIFWGRDPGKEQSLFKLLFADSVQAGRIRKLFILLANGRNVFANFGQAFSFREFVDRIEGSENAIRKLTRVLHFHFLRARTVALGPTLLRREMMVRALLNSPAVQKACASAAADDHKGLEEARAYARKCANEICADYSSVAIRFVEQFLTLFVWHRVYKGIDVRGLERVRELAQNHEIVYLPAHRSHMDYLLMSYSLYHAGIIPPHIAAGNNLNFFPVGRLLRSCGAFYMRRSFSSDRIYTAVFRAYVEALIKRGYSIEFFPEGGRSRTGRLLVPKTGLLSMVTEASLKQRTRRVALLPVYIGYDKCIEVGSYAKELKGAGKSKESAEGLLKASKILGKSYGKPYINFGEAIILQDYADKHLPDWREQFTQSSDTRPAGFPAFVTQLSQAISRRINSAAVANPTGIAAIAMLASPQRAVSRDELIEQIGHLIWLLKGRPISELQYIPDASPKSVLEWAAPIVRIATAPHAWGDVHVIASRDAAALTYSRNNVQHLFALPSLIANFFRTRSYLTEEVVVMGVRAVYPFLRTEFFLRWAPEEIEDVAKEWIGVMLQLGLLLREADGRLRRPEVTSPSFSTLAMLGRVMSETLERYAMTALLLNEERRTPPLKRERFEADCQLLAERAAILTGRDAPEFFDKALFKGHLNTLIDMNLVEESAGGVLTVDARIERIAERALELLSDESRQTLLQLLYRRKPAPGTGNGAGTAAPV